MRLFSYNIHKGIGGRDRRYRLERILDVIEEENPDIVCLQEVDRNVGRTRFDDQPVLLCDHLKLEAHLYQLNVRLKEGGYGNLVMSRWPITTHHQVSLRHNTRKPRGAQIAVVETPEGSMLITHWHLGLAERERHWQVDHLLKHHLFQESAHLPTLIIGDFNDWRNTLCTGPFATHGFHQVTTPPSHFRSFPAWLAMGSLDKAFIRGEVFVKHARIVRSKQAKIASDHLPLVIDFHLSHEHASAHEHGSKLEHGSKHEHAGKHEHAT